MELLSPAESFYVLSPFTSPSQELLKLCLQHLCFEKALQVEEQWLLTHPSHRHERQIIVFHQGEMFSSYQPSAAEAFLLEPFKQYPTLEFYQLRNYIMTELEKDINRFKPRYLYRDVNRSGHCHFRYFLTSKGKRYRTHVNTVLDEIEENIDALMRTDVEGLVKKLENLQSNIFLLEEETLKKLEEIDYEVLSLPNLRFLSSLTTSFRNATYSRMSTVGFGSLGGGFGGGGGSFGGFGGGSFGGGGAGGSW